MGNAVAIGTSSGLNRTSLVLQRSRGLLSSSSTPIADESSSFVASPRLYSHQLLAGFSSSTAGRHSCSSATQPSPAAATQFPPSASLSKPRKRVRNGNSVEIKGQSSVTVVGAAQNPAMVPGNTQQATSVTETQFVEVIEKAMGNALVSVFEKNLVKFKRGVAEALVNKLSEKEAMEKLERDLEELRNKFGEIDTKLDRLSLQHTFTELDTCLDKSEEYCMERDAALKRYIENELKLEKQLEAHLKRRRDNTVCKRF